MPHPSPSSTARAAREAVAARLHELRLDAGISGDQLAARCGWSKSKTSRIENGITPPSARDIRMWCTTCGAADEAPDLVAASRAADSMYTQWKRLEHTGLRRIQESSTTLYQDTQLFRAYCSNVIPGFLQTRRYATALMSAISTFRRLPDDVAEAVEARLRRSALALRRSKRVALLVEEAVLHYRIGDTDVMGEQLDLLRDSMKHHAVSLGVIPLDARRRIWPLETFTVFDDSRVQIDTLSAAIRITQPSEVVTYIRAFGELQSLAVHGADAEALLTRAASTQDSQH